MPQVNDPFSSNAIIQLPIKVYRLTRFDISASVAAFRAAGKASDSPHICTSRGTGNDEVAQ